MVRAARSVPAGPQICQHDQRRLSARRVGYFNARPPGNAAKFHAGRWSSRLELDNGHRCDRRSAVPAAWNWDCGAIFGDARVLFGVYCVDGACADRWRHGTAARIVGRARTGDYLTGRKVPAEECLSIGLCEYVTRRRSRAKAEALAQEIARFPQAAFALTDGPPSRATAFPSASADPGVVNGREALIVDGVAAQPLQCGSADTAILQRSSKVRDRHDSSANDCG